MKAGVLVIAVILTVAGCPRAYAQVLVSDGTFNDSDWTLLSLSPDSSPAASGSFSQVTSGGNPGDYQQITASQNSYDPNETVVYGGTPSYTKNIYVAVLNTAQTYTPSTQGALSALTFSGDFKSSDTEDAVVEFFLEQNGIVYDYEKPIGFFQPNEGPQLPGIYTATWTNFSQTLSASSFIAFGNSSEHPDFSSTGAPIEFGSGVDVEQTSSESSSSDSEYYSLDNFEIQAAPEPSMWMLLLGGWAGMMAFGRRAKRRVRS